MAVMLSALLAGHPSPPGRFLVLISFRDRVELEAIVRLKGLSQLKIFNDLIRNQTRDLPAFSILSQPTTLPHVPEEYTMHTNFILHRMRIQLDCFFKFWEKLSYTTIRVCTFGHPCYINNTEGSCRCVIEVLSTLLPGGNEEREKPQPG
jgi:hypothetical protein